MWKFSIFVISLFLLLSVFNFVQAQEATTTPSPEALVQTLREHVRELQERIAQLQEELTLLIQDVTELEEAIEFTQNLYAGIESEDVKNLQEFLSKHPDIYPEGLITGYFGLLTKNAVKRFQEKYADDILKPLGLAQGTGYVGVSTRAKLNELASAATPAVPAIPAEPTTPTEEPAVPAVPATSAVPDQPATTTPTATTTPGVATTTDTAVPAMGTSATPIPTTVTVEPTPTPTSEPTSTTTTTDITPATTSMDWTTLTNGCDPKTIWSGSEYGVVWSKFCNSGENEIYFARFSSAGTKIGEDLVMSTGHLTADSNYVIAWSGTEYAILWEDYWGNVPLHSNSYSSYDTYFSRVSSQGQKSGTDVEVGTGGQYQDMRLFWNGSEYVLIYINYRPNEIRFRKFSSNGQPLGSIKIISSPNKGIDSLSVVLSGTEYNLTWDYFSGFGGGSESVRLSANGDLITTADTTAPVISNIQATNITTSSATISWSSTEGSNTIVEYGLTTAYGLTASGAANVISHQVSLSNLASSAVYHYRVKSADSAGNLAQSSNQTFTTLTPAPVDTTAPVISNIQVTNITQADATVSWTTDETSDSLAEYGLTTSYGFTVSNATATTSYQINLSSLTSGTTYHYRVKSTDSSGNLAQSSDQTFTTASPPPTPGNLLYRLDGPSSNSYFGHKIALGDVNGDGKKDIIVGAHQTGTSYAGSVYVYSGATGAQLYHFQGNAANERLGYGVASGDVNGDGYSDIIAGSTNGNLYVYSGADGSTLWSFSIGGRAVGIASSDLNGDGKDDVVVGDETFNNFAGRIRVYSGPGMELFNINSPIAQAQVGSKLALADVNGDGKDEIVFPVTDYNNPTGFTCSKAKGYSASVYIHSGADGSLIQTVSNPKSGESFGSSIASAGDVNADGKDDIIVSAPGAEWGGCESGSVYIFSGATGNQLRRFDGNTAYDMLGVSVGGAGDVNNDGRADVIVGASYTDISGVSNIGSAYIYSGADGSLLYSFNGEASGDNFGYQVLGGDVNGNGTPDAIISTISADPNGISNAGSVYIYSLSSSSGALKNIENQLASLVNVFAQIAEKIKELIGR